MTHKVHSLRHELVKILNKNKNILSYLYSFLNNWKTWQFLGIKKGLVQWSLTSSLSYWASEFNHCIAKMEVGCLKYPGASTIGSQPLDWNNAPMTGTTAQPSHEPPHQRKEAGTHHTEKTSVEKNQQRRKLRVHSINRIPEKEYANVFWQISCTGQYLEIYLNATYFISSRLLDITTQWTPKQVISRAYSISGIWSIKHTLRQESNDPWVVCPLDKLEIQVLFQSWNFDLFLSETDQTSLL